MALILCIESTADICSVALISDHNVLSLRESDTFNSHTEMMTLLVQDCLHSSSVMASQLDAVAVSDGPGSYTSLRVGLSVAKGLCYALNIPLITIDSLEILMHGINKSIQKERCLIIPMIDARRMEVYASVFDGNRTLIHPARSVIVNENWYEDIPDDLTVHLCGNGATKSHKVLNKKNYKLGHIQTSAAFMMIPALNKFESGQFSDIAYHTPNYIKSPNITESRKKYF